MTWDEVEEVKDEAIVEVNVALEPAYLLLKSTTWGDEIVEPNSELLIGDPVVVSCEYGQNANPVPSVQILSQSLGADFRVLLAENGLNKEPVEFEDLDDSNQIATKLDGKIEYTFNLTQEDAGKSFFCETLQEDSAGDKLFFNSASFDFPEKVYQAPSLLFFDEPEFYQHPGNESLFLVLPFEAIPPPSPANITWIVVDDETTEKTSLSPNETIRFCTLAMSLNQTVILCYQLRIDS